jgi:Alpha/beta hydrolase family
MSATLLFVHSPVVGPATWSATADVLRQHGFRCVVPSLTATVDAGPPYYWKLAETAACALDGGGPVVLVGHSAAGPVLPAIADAVRSDARAAVFVDAMLPHPGLSWFDTAPPPLRAQLLGLAVNGLLPPWHQWFPAGVLAELMPDPQARRRFVAEIPRVRLAYFEEPAPVTPDWDAVRCAYVRFSAAYDHAADEAERRGWPVVRKDWDHLRMLTAPDAVADLLGRTISGLLG